MELAPTPYEFGTKHFMKTTLVVLFVFCAGAAFGQAGGSISSQAAPISIPDHPGHADIHDMAPEHSLVGGGTYTYAQGERPLWEFGSPLPVPTPLGDVARAFRKEKLTARKAEIIFEKQGS
jgi:hypothetical protein